MSRALLNLFVLLATSATAIVSCSRSSAREPNGVVQDGSPVRLASWDSTDWRPPAVAALGKDSLADAIRRGLALVAATADSLPQFAGGNLNCTSCHLEEGRRGTAAPLTGVFARYPKYIDRTGAVVSMEDRVNYCMTRSLAGARLPNDSREMQDMLAYLAFM